jgi:hypothetical protein
MINKGDLTYTGTDGGICGYFLSGTNIIRSASKRTGRSMLENAAFEGFRKSSNRLKEAAPIAGFLYNQIPKEQRQYSVYRFLTGQAIRMLKEGLDKTAIVDFLYKHQIEPRLLHPENYPPVDMIAKQVKNRNDLICVGRVEGFRGLKTWRKKDS